MMRTLRETRHKTGMTLEDVSSRTNITVAQLSLVERGKAFPRPSTQYKLEQTLKTQIDWMSNMKVKLTPATNVETQRAFNVFVQGLIAMEPAERLRLIKVVQRLLSKICC